MINRLHRSLLLPGRWGNWLLGGVAIAWLGLTLMGIYLTLPLARSMRDKRGARAHYPTASFWSRWRSAWRMPVGTRGVRSTRSDENTSELQSLMRISYTVFCLKTK